jgi:hypothetical protein
VILEVKAIRVPEQLPSLLKLKKRKAQLLQIYRLKYFLNSVTIIICYTIPKTVKENNKKKICTLVEIPHVIKFINLCVKVYYYLMCKDIHL